MLGASLLPARLRHEHKHTGPTLNPSYLNKHITNVLQWFSRSAFTHPIHTIVSVALLASTCYVGVLEGSLLDHTSLGNNVRSTDLASLAEAGRKLQLGDETSWRWKIDPVLGKDRVEDAQQLILLTLVFPDSLSNTSPRNAPLPKEVFTHKNKSVQLLPSTGNPLHSISKDTSLAFAVPYETASTCLDEVQEITIRSLAETAVDSEEKDIADSRRWIMNAAKTDGRSSKSSLAKSARSAWTGFVDLLKNAETLDIVIMILGYLAMHLTFVSLFMSMKHMGSNFWLATSVLISSVFAFLFGLIVTTKLGVPINLVLLSEGLPFLVVTIGFEKPIILTKAVLAASLGHRRPGSKAEPDMMNGPSTSKTIQSSLHSAVRDKGFEIMRDYAIEITILVLGAFSGVQGGLTQFCFLAAWILFFDAILLFTFYTAILSVKLEINRIKRHVATSRALQEEGISKRVAENVATNEELSRSKTDDHAFEANAAGRRSIVFGKKARDSSIPKFKVLMVTGFLMINTVNLCTIPFRSSQRAAAPAVMTGFSNVLSPPSLDPFKVAQNGLELLYHQAFEQDRSIMVTVLPPIKYDINLSEQALGDNQDTFLDGEYTDHLLDYVVGGRVVEGVLKSLEDPIVSKWIILALTISVVLNGYLFNAARWTIKEPRGCVEAAPRHQNRAQSPLQDRGQESQGPEPVKNEDLTVVNGEAAVNTQLGREPRTPADREQMLKDRQAAYLTDSELTDLTVGGKIPGYALEKTLDNAGAMTKLESLTRAVKIRRALVSRTPATSEYTSRLEKSDIPYENYNYENVHGACCENVIGYMPIPLGVAGPMIIDGQSYYLPMATTEGVLVASTNRGCKAINAAGGATTVLTGDGMTRGPCCGFETLARAGAAKVWLDSEDGQRTMRRAFNSTSRFARLQTMKTALAGTYLYIRFKTTTGDAMGMNMISKGVECALNVMMNESGFEDMAIISLSGNYCIDKKPSAINWIDGRGKSVVAEAIIPGDVVRSVLKSDVNALVELNTSKNFIGSAMAGSIGGNNAHAANIVTAMFIATGQDPAQNVESSNCITIMRNLNGNLQISVSMPCIEVGTIGGGTVLEPQGACLDLLGVRGAHSITPGTNARQLARIVAAAVLAGELSLCSALAAGHLVKAHMAHNRSAVPTRSSTPVAAAVSSAPSKGQMAEGLCMTIMR